MKKKIQLCDCTLRDGGYYTNWDFNVNLVKMYFTGMNEIQAITHLEIGYRSKPMKEYFGEYFYCPDHVLKMAKKMCPSKEIAIMLNEKDTKKEDLDELLSPCIGLVDLVRIAVDPKNMERASKLAVEIKKRGFKMAFNIMYMSQWANDKEFIKSLNQLNGKVDYIYMVDSFGGIYPEDVKEALEIITAEINIAIGFHGHNNMELGLANSLMAIENGCSVIDATITGMGRGAGNLKTELLLTCLNSKEITNVDFNKLNPIVVEFEKMQKDYQWGTNLPYMISGAYSLPQKEVMSWISKRRFTTESIINALQNKKNKLIDNHHVQILEKEQPPENAIIIGGGSNTIKHAHALKIFCRKYPETILIHAGTRYVKTFNDLPNKQYFCLLGAEGFKLEKVLPSLELENIKCILEPSPRKMGTILPQQIIDKTYELPEMNFSPNLPDSLLTIALQFSINIKAKNIYLFGFDGYDMKTDEQMIEVSKENQELISSFINSGHNLISFTPSNYNGFTTLSIYSKL